jgi:predicted N-acetyltransferase YhbS
MEDKYKIESLAPDDFEKWVEHCGAVFEDTGCDYFRRHFMADPDRSYESTFLVKDRGEIVSTVRVFHRRIWLGGKALKMGGIGEVSTKPSHRSLGLSGRLLNASINYMEINGFDISLLGTSLSGHYSKHGYVTVNECWKTLIADNGVNESYDFRSLTPADYPAMSALYDKYAPLYNLTMVRSMEYWNSWCRGEMKNPVGLFINGCLEGYICSDRGFVSEIICAPSMADMLLSSVKCENGKLVCPGITPTAREVIDEKEIPHLMIRLIKPAEVFDRTFTQTADLADYINKHGGATIWMQDGF